MICERTKKSTGWDDLIYARILGQPSSPSPSPTASSSAGLADRCLWVTPRGEPLRHKHNACLYNDAKDGQFTCKKEMCEKPFITGSHSFWARALVVFNNASSSRLDKVSIL